MSCVSFLRFSGILALASSLLASTASLHAQVAPAPSDEAIRLAQFTVEAGRASGYRVANAITATGIGTAILDTPIAVNVLTGGLIEDLGIGYELRDVLQFVPSVRTQERNESSFRVRGFESLSLLRNGYFRRQLFPTWNIDRVEVIKGATAIFHGSARPGGVINYVTRKPSFTPQTEFSLVAGSHDYLRGEFHHTAPIGDDTAYRLGFGYYDGKGFRDFWHNEGDYKGFSLVHRFGDRAELTIDLEQISQNVSDQESTDLFLNNAQNAFAPIYPENDPAGYRYNLGGPDSFRDYASNTVEANFLYRVTDRIVYRLEANYSQDDFEVLRTLGTRENSGANAGTVNINAGYFANYRNNRDVKNTLVGIFNFGGAKHTLMAGHQYQEIRNRTPGFGRQNGRQGPVFRYEPTTGRFPEFPTLAPAYPLSLWSILEGIGGRTRDGAWNDNRRITEEMTGLFLLDSIEVMQGRLRVMAGVRRTELKRDLFWESTPNTVQSIRQSRTVPQLGVLFKFTPALSAFASFSQSLEPQNQIDADGRSTGPIEGEGYELGFKVDTLDGRVSGTISIFQLERGNVAVRDPVREGIEGRSPLFFFGTTQRVRGFEADLAFNPLANWQVLLNGSWLWQAETVAALTPAGVGLPFVQTPTESINLWTRYDFDTGPAKGLELGLGVQWAGDYLAVPNVTAPSTTRVNVLARYPFEFGGGRHSLALNVSNLLDERQLGGGPNWTNPREFTVTWRTRF